MGSRPVNSINFTFVIQYLDEELKTGVLRMCHVDLMCWTLSFLNKWINLSKSKLRKITHQQENKREKFFGPYHHLTCLKQVLRLLEAPHGNCTKYISQFKSIKLKSFNSFQYDHDLKQIKSIAPKRISTIIQDYIPVDQRSEARVLDVAAGTGRLGPHLVEIGFKHLDAVGGFLDIFINRWN